VRKLARQGWKTEEIARAVKISRGEVELILELGEKK
jgi:transcriptional regulator